MYNVFTVAIFCCFLVGNTAIGLIAQNNYTSTPDSLQYQSLLWEITGNNLTKPSYLYGTMHARDMRVHAIAKQALPYLKTCDALALELVLDTDLNVMASIKSMKGMFMKGTSLKKLYDNKEDYKKVKSYVKDKLGVMGVLFNVDKIKPIFMTSLLQEMGASKDQTEQATLPLDFQLQQIGTANGQLLFGLETMEEQFAALDKYPLKEQALVLLDQVNNEAKHDSVNQYMMDRYLAQDLDALYQMYDNEKEDMHSDFEEALVTTRNVNMANRMDTMMQKRSAFTAVGALHLPGNGGVIELLREKGYTLKPVSIGNDNNLKPNVTYLATQWQIYTAQEEQFSVKMPGKVSAETIGVDDVIMHAHYDESNELLYSVSRINIIDGEDLSDEEFLELAVQQMYLKTLSGSEKTIVQGHAARKGLILPDEKIPNSYLKYLLIRYDDMAYLLSLTGSKGKLQHNATNPFFESFRILE